MHDNPLVDPITNVPVIESEEFYGVFEGHIGKLDAKQLLAIVENILEPCSFSMSKRTGSALGLQI
ncbi:hypothetical protein Bhyg_07973 [Pseudolycoriella hygida]|uniref:Uncharacterized protein n=1 Tax=Pseudolycoriella hygida TaxID=35572 RepID=A0A9Q0S2I2_9DIPT|nr:hypothetical protein Bhyg_07973 [Pseudolycoriella hygida]